MTNSTTFKLIAFALTIGILFSAIGFRQGKSDCNFQTNRIAEQEQTIFELNKEASQLKDSIISLENEYFNSRGVTKDSEQILIIDDKRVLLQRFDIEKGKYSSNYNYYLEFTGVLSTSVKKEIELFAVVENQLGNSEYYVVNKGRTERLKPQSSVIEYRLDLENYTSCSNCRVIFYIAGNKIIRDFPL